jgi:phage gp29-like protein
MSPFFQPNKQAMDALLNRKRSRAQYYFPLKWLTETYLENLIEQGKMGNHWEVQSVFDEIEERFEPLTLVIDRRLGALGKLSWEVKALNGGDTLAHKMAVEEGKAFFNNLRGLEKAIAHMALAKFRGFSHLQIITDAEGNVIDLEPTPHYLFKQEAGKWWVRTDRGGELFPVTPDSFVSWECARPIDPAAARRFVKSLLGEADYGAAVEDAGIFALFMEMPPNVSVEDREAFEKQAELAIAGMRGTIPSGAKPHQIGNANGGSLNLFEDYLGRQEEKVILVGTGGLLTALAKAGGLGNGAAEVHDDAFNDLALADAAKISQLFTRQLLEPWLRAQFPGTSPLAYFEISAKDTDDLNAEALRLVQLSNAGHKAKSDWVADKFGVELETPNGDAGLPVTTPPSLPAVPVANAAKDGEQEIPTRFEATLRLAAALGDQMTPAFQALTALANKDTLTEDDFLNLLEAMETTSGSKDTEAAFNEFYSAALLNGWAGNPEN